MKNSGQKVAAGLLALLGLGSLVATIDTPTSRLGNALVPFVMSLIFFAIAFKIWTTSKKTKEKPNVTQMHRI